MTEATSLSFSEQTKSEIDNHYEGKEDGGK